MLESLLDNRFVPDSPGKTLENLCLDAGYVGKQEVVSHGYELHIRPRDEEKKELETTPDFRDPVGCHVGLVEAFHTWMKRFRKLCPRYEKTLRSFQALLSLAAGLIALNKIITNG